MENRQSARASRVDAIAHLPRLASLADMDGAERHAALAAWVFWFNSHRDQVSRDLELELDGILEALDKGEPVVIDEEALQKKFDEWLSSAGYIGRGEGPDAYDDSPAAEMENWSKSPHERGH